MGEPKAGIRHGVPVLLYHAVSPAQTKTRLGQGESCLYELDREQFEKQMAFLADNGFSVISLEDYFRRQENSDGQTVILTFDDGHLSNFEVSMPILLKFGFRATFFLTVGWLELPNFLTWEQVLEMQNQGMSIQSHGMSHTFLTSLDKAGQLFELQESKAILERKLNRPISYFSLPGGRYDRDSFPLAASVSYQAVCTSKIGLNAHPCPLFLVERIGIKRTFSLDTFAKILRGRRTTLFCLKGQQFLLDMAKRGLGDSRYVRLRKTLLNNSVP